MATILHNGRSVKARLCKVFPGRYSWTCPDCGSLNQSFEADCPACEWKREHAGLRVKLLGDVVNVVLVD